MLEPPNHKQPSSRAKEIQIVEEDERLVGDERQIVVGAESHNENHTSENAAPATSVTQEDAPKKSYASIVSSQTKKGPTKIYVPSNSRMAPAKAEKQPVKSVAQAPGRESSIPTASGGNAPESKDAQYGGIISKNSCTCMIIYHSLLSFVKHPTGMLN